MLNQAYADESHNHKCTKSQGFRRENSEDEPCKVALSNIKSGQKHGASKSCP